MKYKSADNINIDLLNETEPSQEAAHITQIQHEQCIQMHN